MVQPRVDKHELPDFGSDELEACLRCGMLEQGVAHFAGQQRGEAKVVAF